MPYAPPKALAVYCGSSYGNQSAFTSGARSVGAYMAKHSIQLVYGGGKSGLMGIVSSTVLENGGKVLGVVPYQMLKAGGEKPAGHDQPAGEVDDSKDVDVGDMNPQLENIIVDSMHERKVEMAKRSDAFIGLPGGFGTFEEVLEVATWTQLGIHCKPVILLNIHNFYNPLRTLIESSISAGFIRPANSSIITFVDGPSNIAEHDSFNWGDAALKAYEKWFEEDRGVDALYNWNERMRAAAADGRPSSSASGKLQST